MSKKGIGKLLAGIGIGTVIGLVAAPKSGKETRKDIKNQANKVVKKIKDVDFDALKDDLLNDFESFKEEIKDMDIKKAKELAASKGEEILKKAEDLITQAKEASKPVYLKAAKDIKKKLSDILADLSKKLDEE